MSNRNTGYSSIPVQSNGLLTTNFSISQKQNISIDNFNIQDINIDEIIKKALKSYNDASFNNVDISGNMNLSGGLITDSIYVDNCVTFY